MNKTYKDLVRKSAALFLALCLTLCPAAYALTPAQLKEILQETYLDGVSDAVLQAETIEDILTLLGDTYTKYFTAQEYKTFLASMEDQEIGGIGCALMADEKGLLMTEVYENSPAAKAGLKAGDCITVVDGKPLLDLDLDTAVELLRGEIGSTVTLGVLHADGSQKDYQLTRALVVIPTTSYELLEGNVGYINCRAFGLETQQHFLDAAKEMSQAKNLIVDLRANPGGDLNAVAQILGIFLGQGEIVYLRDGQDEYRVQSSTQDRLLTQPTIILTSGVTASASEIFAAVMRDRDMGLVVGETTFGKGVAQVLLDERVLPTYFPDGDALKVTAYRYFTRAGNTADHIGVIPHLMVNAYDAPDIARLLSEPAPTQTDKSDFLRLRVDSWTGYLSLKRATSDEQRYYFMQLLQALPPKADVERGTTTGVWQPVTVERLVQDFALKEYQSRALVDLTGHPNQMELNTLATYGLVQGDAARQYQPDKGMTRAELCALLVQAFGLRKAKNPVSFSDVQAGDWYEQAVQAAVAEGFMNGVGDGRFAPQEPLTQEQLISVLGRAASRVNSGFYEAAKKYQQPTNPAYDTVSTWARQWVWLLNESQQDESGAPVNLLYTELSALQPQQMATRAQAGVQLYRILNYTNILPN